MLSAYKDFENGIAPTIYKQEIYSYDKNRGFRAPRPGACGLKNIEHSTCIF